MTDVKKILETNKNLDIVKFTTAGSVDDGKSTLIGRLLYDSKGLYQDQLLAVEKDSKKLNRNMDLALLADGLKAEREQGITIDVAYRYFSTPKRKFIISDTPGHEQYTRNMATGASNANVAIILVNAKNGLTIQSKRHAFISSLLGIHKFVLAINKMDLVDYSEEVYLDMINEFKKYCVKLNISDLKPIPICALNGDNVVAKSLNMPWYNGPTILEYLENVYVEDDYNLQDFRFPVQLVSRPNSEFRGFLGTIASGIVRKNDEVIILPSMKRTKIKSIVTYDGEIEEAFAPMSVTLTLKDEIDVTRGCMIAKPNNMPIMNDYLDANLVWMSEKPAKLGDEVLLKNNYLTVKTIIDKIQYVFNPSDLTRKEQDYIELNQIARVRLKAYKEVIYDEYKSNKQTGDFILIDIVDNNTIAAGMFLRKINMIEPQIKNSVIKSSNITKITHKITKEDRSSKYKHNNATIWFTGLSASGKSTIAIELEKELFNRNCFCYLFDGDNVRFGLNRDLGFTEQDRQENIRRIAEVAKLFNDAGGIAITAFITPLIVSRNEAKKIIGDNYIEVFLDVPIEECQKRDPKGLYKKAIKGEILDFTGISSPYEKPENPDITIDTTKCNIEESVQIIINYLKEKNII